MSSETAASTLAPPPLAQIEAKGSPPSPLPTPDISQSRGGDPHPTSPPQPVISCRNLGKLYHVYARPQDRLKQALFRWKRKYYKDFWALRSCSFEVMRGEAVGILGR